MNHIPGASRRNFIKKLAATSAIVAIDSNANDAEEKAKFHACLKRTPARLNDQINFVLIGKGGMANQYPLNALA